MTKSLFALSLALGFGAVLLMAPFASATASEFGSTCQVSSCSTADDDKDVPTSFDTAPKVGTKARCPVMGGVFTITEKTERSEYEGRHYAFCCAGCKPKFDADPAKFTDK